MSKKEKKSKKEQAPPAAIMGKAAPGFLTNQEKAMLSAAIQLLGKFDLSTALPVGEYPINGSVVIELAGLSKKFGEESYTPTVAIPHTLVLDAVLSKMGAVGPAVEAQVFTILEEALEQVARGSISAEGLKSITNRREEITERTRARLDAMPKRTRAGKFCTDGDVRAIRIEGVDDVSSDAEETEDIVSQ